MSRNLSRLVLGTVQLGMPYGIANRAGKPDADVATAVVSAAWQGGIRFFDTAQAYGDSEAVLGGIFQTLEISDQVNVISKLPPDIDGADQAAVSACVEKSFERLRVPSLYGLMLHREEMLDDWNKGLGDVLAGFKNTGRTRHIGVSVYTPERAFQALETPGVDLIQIPASIFDRRFESARLAESAARRGCELHIRSVFLQGLLLMAPEKLSAAMSFAKPVLTRFAELAAESGLTQQEAALLYIRERWPQAKVLFGAESEAQVCSNMNCWQKPVDPAVFEKFDEAFSTMDEKIIRPDRWPK